jgi:hypothetical protein
MVKLIDILIEARGERKESIKKTYHTYSCIFIIKFKKKFNRVQAVERVRGIKSVTIVDLRGDERLDKINRTLSDYEYSTVEIKYITNKDPRKHLEYIKKAMVGSDKKQDIDNIVGIAAAKPKLDTLIQLD